MELLTFLCVEFAVEDGFDHGGMGDIEKEGEGGKDRQVRGELRGASSPTRSFQQISIHPPTANC